LRAALAPFVSKNVEIYVRKLINLLLQNLLFGDMIKKNKYHILPFIITRMLPVMKRPLSSKTNNSIYVATVCSTLKYSSETTPQIISTTQP